jgi:hypothetical protein
VLLYLAVSFYRGGLNGIQMMRSFLISLILSVATVWSTLGTFGVVPEFFVTINVTLIVLVLLFYTKPLWSFPVYILLASMFIFNWAKPALQPVYEIIELGATGVLSGGEMTLLNQDAVDVVINAAFACSSSFLIVLLFAQNKQLGPSAPGGQCIPVSGSKTARWLRLLFALGCAGSLVESGLYGIHYLRDGNYFDIYRVGEYAITPFGLASVASLAFLSFIGLATLTELSPSRRQLYTVAFVVVTLLQLLKGARGEPLLQLVAAAWALLVTGSDRRIVVRAVCLGAALFLIAETVSELRTRTFGDGRHGAGDRVSLIDFIIGQGVSGQIVGLANQSIPESKQDARYLLGPIMNPVRRIIDPTFGSQTKEYGEASNLLAHELSYNIDPEAYLSGRGVGSSFVAEWFLALGYTGAVVGTVLLVFLVITGSQSAMHNRHVLFLLSCTLPYLWFTARESFVFALIPAFKAWLLLVFIRYNERSNSNCYSTNV